MQGKVMQLSEQLRRICDTKSMMASLPHHLRAQVLRDCAEALKQREQKILDANKRDLAFAKTLNLNAAMLERLALDSKKIANMAESLYQIADFPDPLNRVLGGFSNHCGLEIQKVSAPLGVIAIIYESRPNVTSDVAALCFKSGNACVLKGGKEAQNSNEAIIEAFYAVLEKHHLPKDCMILLPAMRDREELKDLLSAKGLIDLVIPRGGE